MSLAITIEIPQETRLLIKALEDFPEAMRDGIARGMDKGAGIALGKITRERFTGHGPFPVEEHRLGVRTNELRASLRWTPAEVDGDSITGSMGSNVAYFGAHEFGFDGEVRVKAFCRTVSPSQFVKRGGAIAKLPKGKSARKKALGTEEVSAHTRHMHIPARSPMGHGIADHLDDFTTQITAELRTTWIAKVRGS